MSDRDPSQERLLELFEYKDGKLFNKINRGRARKGQRVGSKNFHTGYIQMGFEYKSYYAHRLVWIIHNGDIPEGLILDHINGIKTDNRIENLRVVTKQENAFNMRNIKGYSWIKRDQKYIAQIWTSGIKIHLGYFDNKEDAAQAYQVAKEKYHIIENR